MRSAKARKVKQQESPANQQAGSIFFDRFSLWFMDRYGLEELKRLKARGTKGSRRERGSVVTVKA